jgi:MATE family multidrug resistance protein
VVDVETRAPTLRGLLNLAWPIVVSRSAQVVVGFADAVMVARLSEAALAAVTTGAFNAYLAFILPMGTVFIVSSFTSQLWGKRKLRAARRFGTYGVGFSIAAGVGFALLTPLVGPALSLFAYEPAVAELMTAYLSVRLLSGFAAVGLEAIANYYYGLGNSRLPMFAQLCAMVLNVALNWLLIFGNLGFPALGVAGAAWASVIASAVAFAGLLFCFVRRIGEPVHEEPEPDEPPDRSAEVRRMLRFGLPSGINWFLEMGAFVFFINVVVTGLGTTALAAMNAVIELNSVSFMPAFGIASAGAVIFGQALGGKQLDHARKAVRLTVGTCAVWQLAVGLAYLSAPRFFLGAFSDDELSVFFQLGVPMLMISAAWQLFDSVASALMEALRAAGDTVFVLWARVFIAWVLFVPGSLYFVRYGEAGHHGAVLCLVGYLGALALALAWRYRSGRWQEISLTAEPEAGAQ